MHHTPLFNNLPNNDNSLELIRLTSTLVNPPSTPHHHIPTLHLISPPRPAQNIAMSSSETVAEDLTEDVGQTIASLASRMSILENSLGSIASSLEALARQNQNHHSKPPASHEGAGAAS